MVLGILGICLAMDGASAGVLGRDVTLLVIPARPRVVQVALDMVQLRSVTLVTWYGATNTAEPLLHLWAGSDWQYVSLSDFTDKTFMAGNVSKAIVVGDDQIVPRVLLASMPWCSNVERLKTINVADLVNGFDKTFKFREKEWKWLAERYELTLTDLNAERRTRNPYATPRSKLPLEKREFKQEKGDMPPAKIIEEKPVVTPISAAMPDPKPDDKPLK
jgi:hypothetical protein